MKDTQIASNRIFSRIMILIIVIFSLSAAGAGNAAAAVEYVVHVSVDGLRSDVISLLGPDNLPNLHRMRIAGIFTDNARTDYDYTNTLPNHSCMLTGRPVLGADGHGVSFNSDTGTTFEAVKGYYIAGVFDLFHDNGHSTGMYASKSKFDFFERSWNGVNGAPDTTGIDDGRDKIDIYLNLADTDALIDSFTLHMTDSPLAYSFVHLTDPDAVGHDHGWESAEYYQSVMKVDTLLGRIYSLVDDGPMTGVTAVILTVDHGGMGTTHDNPLLPENYTIPVLVTGPGVPSGSDIYTFNPTSRRDPLGGRPSYDFSPQPARNGGTCNLALGLLGLGPIHGSVINSDQDLDVMMPNGGDDLPTVEITSPLDGTLINIPATIDIEAAAAGGGPIERVEFYGDWTLLGEDSTSPYTWTWENVSPGEHSIAARAVRSDGIAAVDHIDLVVESITGAVGMEGIENIRIYPHPVRGSSTILFSLSVPEHVEMVLFDALGRRIDTIMGGLWGPGTHSADLDASRLAPGFYFYKLGMGAAVSSGKILVLR